MTKIILGADPDADKSGIAIYKGGELIECKSMSLIDIYLMMKVESSSAKELWIDIELHIENLNGNKSSAFNYNRRDSKAVMGKKSESVGKCKQVQTEIERIAEYFDIKIVRHPVSPMWKSQIQKKVFESVTGWKGSSNEDSRSAAYFGYLGLITGKTT